MCSDIGKIYLVGFTSYWREKDVQLISDLLLVQVLPIDVVAKLYFGFLSTVHGITTFQ